MPGANQFLNNRRTDESGRTGHKNTHEESLRDLSTEVTVSASFILVK
jgi:hypothetical protein